MDMYDKIVTTVRTSGGVTIVFPITVGLYQESTLSPYLIALEMDEITR